MLILLVSMHILPGWSQGLGSSFLFLRNFFILSWNYRQPSGSIPVDRAARAFKFNNKKRLHFLQNIYTPTNRADFLALLSAYFPSLRSIVEYYCLKVTYSCDLDTQSFWLSLTQPSLLTTPLHESPSLPPTTGVRLA